MSNKVSGVVRRISTDLSVGSEADLGLSMQGALRVQENLPRRFESARAGRRFCYSPGVIANSQVPVADVPTTTAKYCLWNGEPQTGAGRSYIIEMVGFTASSGTTGLGASLLCGVTKTVQSGAVTGGTGVVLGTCGGQGSSSLATFGNGITLAAAPAWIAVGSMDQPAAVSVGSGLSVFVDGLFVVRPGCCLGMVVFAPLGTTAKFGCHVVWSEYNTLDMESGS